MASLSTVLLPLVAAVVQQWSSHAAAVGHRHLTMHTALMHRSVDVRDGEGGRWVAWCLEFQPCFAISTTLAVHTDWAYSNMMVA